MLNISKLSIRYSVQRMQDSDANDILSLCLQNTQYYAYCGKQPSKELILQDLHITPPGTDISSKYYIGYYEKSVLVAIMDLIEGYPNDDNCFIGFFMMNRQLQGNHIGSGIIEEVCQYLKKSGFSAILLGIDKGNPQSKHFWHKNGFQIINEVKQSEGIILVAKKEL